MTWNVYSLSLYSGFLKLYKEVSHEYLSRSMLLLGCCPRDWHGGVLPSGSHLILQCPHEVDPIILLIK